MRWLVVFVTMLGGSLFAAYDVASYKVTKVEAAVEADIQLQKPVKPVAKKQEQNQKAEIDEADLAQLQLEQPERYGLTFLQFFYTKDTHELYEVLVQKPKLRPQLLSADNLSPTRWQHWVSVFRTEYLRHHRSKFLPEDEVAIGFSAVA